MHSCMPQVPWAVAKILGGSSSVPKYDRSYQSFAMSRRPTPVPWLVGAGACEEGRWRICDAVNYGADHSR